MHEVLVNHLGGLSLPRKSVVKLTDRPDMPLDVCVDVKQQHNSSSNNNNNRAKADTVVDIFRQSLVVSSVVIIVFFLLQYFSMFYLYISLSF